VIEMAVFIKNPDIVQAKDEVGPYLYNKKTGDSARIDEAMLFIWMLCDGKKNEMDIAREVAAYTGDSIDSVYPLVLNILGSLLNLGFIKRIA